MVDPKTPRLHRRTPRKAAVVGGGIAGLVAAKDLQAAGWQVNIYDAGTDLGGCVGVHEVAGLRLDSGAESFATRNTAVAELAKELGLGEEIVEPDPAGAWVWLPDGPVQLPKTGILGIPSDLSAPEVREALGAAGLVRAALDARMPATVGTGEEAMSVAELVTARMGKRVLERLVTPVVGGVHSADPADLDVDMVAPGLRAGIKTHGSLAAAVAAQRAAGSKPGSAVGGLRGGMNRLVTALTAALVGEGVALHKGYLVESVSHSHAEKESSSHQPTGTWTLNWRDGKNTGSDNFELLVMATDGPTAVKLLEPSLPELTQYAPASGPDIHLVTLVVDLPELDKAPRGTGVLISPEVREIKAKALTHSTAKWEWLAEEAGPGTHVLRLSYGRAGLAPSDAVRLTPVVLSDADRIATALKDASTILGLPISADDVLGADVVRWNGSLPFAAVGHKAKIATVHQIANQQSGLVLTGAWMSGNGLAAVVASTRRQIAAVIDKAARS